MILREIGRQWRPIIHPRASISIRRLDSKRNAQDACGIISDVKTNSGLSAIFGSALCLIMMAGCTSQQQNPDELREKTAQATATLKTDAKAVAEGVREGLNRDKPLDLNQATKVQLLTLPGITNVRADRVIAGRPYSRSEELVSHHILTTQEYDRIKDRVTAKN
jgi:DNA uptake protein ComE-like DNA-binding protein